MGAFQTGFSIGKELFQQSLDNKWREENRQRDDEERALRMDASRLAIEQARRTAANQTQADELTQQLVSPNAGNYTLTNPKASGAGLRMPSTMAAADQAGPVNQTPMVDVEAGPVAPAAPAVAPVASPVGLRMPASAGAATAMPDVGLRPAMPAASGISLKAAPTRGDSEALLGRIALLKGDTAGFRAAQTNQRTLQEDDLFAQKLGEYTGTADQVAGTAAYLNNNSRRLTMGTPDKNGLVQLAVAKDDGTASFLNLSKQDQAKLYAAGHLLERNPTRALEMMAAVNKELAAAVAADNGLTSSLAGNSNDVAGKSATMTYQANVDKRAETVFADTQSDRLKAKTEDQLFAQKLKEYSGTPDQVSSTAAYLNNNSRRLTMGKPDKNGLVQLSLAKDDGTASFLNLTKQDQAKLYAAGHLLEFNPTKALEMMAGVNKELAAVVAADNGLTANLTSNSNDVAGKSATMTYQGNADKRATAAAADVAADKKQAKADAQAKANAGVALYQEQNPAATPAQLAAVRAGVIEAVATADKNAPSEVKLANALRRAGLATSDADALKQAMQSKSDSPEKTRAEIYAKALTANMGDAARAKEATEEAMSYLYPAGSATAAKPASAAPAPAAALPAVKDRVVGKEYPTSRGPAIWRGTGWELVTKP